MIKSSLQESVDDAAREEEVLRAIFLTRDASEWEEFLRRHKVPAGRIRELDEALLDPQLRHRAVLQEVVLPGRDGSTRLPASAFLMSEGDPEILAAPPVLDEHGEQIRSGLRTATRG